MNPPRYLGRALPLVDYSLCCALGPNLGAARARLFEGGSGLGRAPFELPFEAPCGVISDPLPELPKAFAAYDTHSGELLLARDPFGEKPLYYCALAGGGWAFASELQALETLPGFDAEASLDAIAELLLFQYVGAPRTIYRSVQKLPHGMHAARPRRAHSTGIANEVRRAALLWALRADKRQ